MAIESQTISTQEIKPIFAFDTDNQALGTAHTGADDFYDFGILSYTIPYNSSTLEVAPNLAGHYGQLEKQGRHRQDLNTWTFDVSFLGTTNALKANCLWAFGDMVSPFVLTPEIGIGNGTAGDMQMLHGASSDNHTTAIFRNGGTDASADDMTVRGAMIQSMTIKQDINANAGLMTIDSTFFTAYPPTEAANTVTVDNTDAGNAAYSIFDLNTNSDPSAIELNSVHLMPLSWEITISRTLERVGSQDYSSYLPYAIVQTGAWEVTGSLNVKADDGSYDLASILKGTSAGVNLSIDQASNLTIDLPKVMVDSATLDNGGSFLTHTIPFRAFAEAATDASGDTENIISIAAS